MKMTGLKSFNRRGIVAAFIGVLGILGAQRDRVWANDVTFRETIYNTDYIAVGVGSMRDASSASMSVSGISGTVNKAYLYWHGPMNSTNPLANATIRLNNQNVTGVNIGYSDDNCWGFNNSQAYRADVTSIVRAERNGTYFFSQFVKQGTNINANGASLLVFFTDSNTNNNRDVVLFEGNDSNADSLYDAPGWNVMLDDLNYLDGRGFIQLHVSDGQIYEDDAVVLNGEVLEGRGEVFQGTTVQGANNGPAGSGRLWDIKTYDVTSVLASGTNAITITHGYIGTPEKPKGDCVSLIVAAINLPAGTVPPPPPANTIPVVTGTPELTVNTPNAIPVQALATDADGDPLSYTIAVDGVVVQTGTIPAGTPATSGTIAITNGFALGQHTVVFTVNDGEASGSFTTVVNVIDDKPPVLTVPANITVPTDPGKTNAVVNYVVTATDDFPGVTVISLPPPGSAFPIGTTVVTATAVDASGKSTNATFTITVTDCMPPTVNCPSDILRPTDPGASNAVVHFTVNATDNLPGVTVSCNPPSGSTFQMGITMVVCSARDAKGNTAGCMFRVTIVDREPHVIIVPPNQTIPADSGTNSTVINYTVEVRDNVPGATVVCVPPSGSAVTIGVTNVVCIATDSGGNNTTNSFTVTVVDNEKPVLNVPSDIVKPAEPGKTNAVVNYTVTATDNSGSVNVVCLPPSGSTFPLGSTLVTCTATDPSGNSSTNSFTISVVDLEPPVVTVPPGLVVPTDPGRNTAVVTYVATVTDNVPGATISCVPPSGATFPLGVTTVVCVGTDTSNNKSTNSFTVTVEDREKPVLNLPPNIIRPVDPGLNTAVVTYTVIATDNSGSVNVSCIPASGSVFPLGITTVNCTATDPAGNSATGSFTITVTNSPTGDNQPPVVNVPANITVPNDPGQSNAVVNYIVTVTDDRPGATVACVPPSGATFPLGTTTVVCIGTDTSNNASTNSFTVTVVDNEKPRLEVPPAVIRPIDPGGNTAVVTYTVTAIDNSGSVNVVCLPPSGSAFPLGITTVNCSATDPSGNTTNASFTVTVYDNTVPDNQPPVVTVPNNITVPNDPGTNHAVVNFTVTVTDDRPGATVACVPPSGSQFPLGLTTVVCVGSDIAGNRTTNSFTVTVVDNEKPVLTLPPNIVRGVDPGRNTAVVTYSVTARDNSGSVSVICVPPSGAAFPLGVTTVNCTAIDDAANTASGSFTITVTNGIVEPPKEDCLIVSNPVLWPPNHKMVPISIWLNYQGKPVRFSSVRILSVTSNEPETGLWPDDQAPDWEITNTKNLKLKLRAERDDNGSGRVYTIVVEGKDSKKNTYLCTATVTVPKDPPPKKKKK